jgi:hypothetical protein
MRHFFKILLLYFFVLNHCNVYAVNNDIFVTQTRLGSRAVESGGKAIDPNTRFTIISPPSKFLFFPVGYGTVTGLTNTHDTYWVQNLRYSENGKLMIDVCRSYVRFLWIEEWCTAVEADQNVDDISVKTESFDYFNPGINSASESNHKPGYVFNLYSSKCPYKLAASKQSSCELFASDKIEGFYSNNVDYSMHNNCYLMYKQLSSTCSNPSNCVCEASNGNCGVNNYFMPSSAFLQTKDNDTKKCYKCHANYRKALSDCLNASFDNANGSGFGVDASNKSIYKNNINNQEMYNMFQKSYGLGGYLCGYVDGARAGCIKIQIPPSRPLPRIAMILDKGYSGATQEPFKYYPAANLFESDLRVDKFDNETEVGEPYRGTFFKPKIKLAYGANARLVEFQLKDNAYLTYVADENDRSYSSWSENYPGAMEYGVFDKNQNVILNKTDVAYFCTRIEYNKDRNTETYAAYVVQDPDLIYDRSVRLGEYVDTTKGLACKSLSQNGSLKKIGYANRPTLKYTYKDGKVLSPVKIIINGSTDKIIKALVKIYPDLSPSADNLPSSFKKSILSESLPLSTFLMTVPADLTADYSIFMQGYSTKCGYLLNKKICIDYNICDIMRQIPSGIRLGTESCSSDRCKIALDTFNKIKNYCMLNTNCDSSDGDLTTCISKKPSYQKMDLNGVPAEYDNRYQWRPEVCISQGFEEANFDKGGNVQLYGSFGDLNKYNNMIVSFDDTDIDTRYKDIYQIFKLPMRDIASKSEKYLETKDIINLSLNTSKADGYFTSTSTMNAKESLLDLVKNYKSSLVDKYNTIGCDNACFANSLIARTRNARELGMCAEYYNNFIYKYGGYSKVSSGNDALIESSTPSGIEYKHYIPLKCDAMEARVFGGGGSGNTFTYHERLQYRWDVVWKCTGESLKFAFEAGFCWLYGGCDEVEHKRQYVDYICNDKLTNGGGGGGGYSHGLININSSNESSLSIYQVIGYLGVYDDLSYINFGNNNVLSASRGQSKARNRFAAYGGSGVVNNQYLMQDGYVSNNTSNNTNDDVQPTEPIRPNIPIYDQFMSSNVNNICSKTKNSIGICSELKQNISISEIANYSTSVNGKSCNIVKIKYSSNKTLCTQLYDTNGAPVPNNVMNCDSVFDNPINILGPYPASPTTQPNDNVVTLDICCPSSQECFDQEVLSNQYQNDMIRYVSEMSQYQARQNERNQYIYDNIDTIRQNNDLRMNSFIPTVFSGTSGNVGPGDEWNGEQGIDDANYNQYRNAYSGGGNLFKNYIFQDNKWERVDNNTEYSMVGNDCYISESMVNITNYPSWLIWSEKKYYSLIRNTDCRSTQIVNYKYSAGGCSNDTNVNTKYFGDAPSDFTFPRNYCVDSGDFDHSITKNIFGSKSEGMTTLTCPMIKYNIETMKPRIENGKKVLYNIDRDRSSYDIVRDPDCIAKCPPAYIRTHDSQYVCEYSSLEPSNGYETRTDTTVYPAKCFGSDGKVYSPMTNLCYSTKCNPGGLGTRFSQYCNTGSVYDVNRFFMINASFGSDRVSDSESDKYCDKSIQVTYNGDLMKYPMYCNENGIWQYPDKMQYGDNDNYFIKTFYNTNKLAVFEKPNIPGSQYQCANIFGWPKPC